ncbi:hypothetical protein Ndes2526B_g02290 [Nannochloris sp. 'desiccata']
MGRAWNSSIIPQKLGLGTTRDPAQSTPALNQRILKCKAATEDDIIDVEGKEIDNRIPVTVITGFLGSGKTTLLNRILNTDHGHRIAVIENEFGEIDIDSDLVSIREDLDPENEQILMLNNGCLCCTVRDDLVQMLNKLHKQRDKFDRVVIETTGLANPAPIIQTFFLEPTIADNMKLDGVLTLVDAKHIEQHLDEIKPDGVVNEAIEQVAYADRIVLNKTDLVSTQDLERLEQRIKGINALAEIRRTQRAEVPLDYVLGVGGFDLEKIEDEIAAYDARKAKEAAEKEAHNHNHSHEAHSHEHHDHGHAHGDGKEEDGHECGPGCTHSSHDHSHSHDHDHSHEHSHDHVHDDSVTSVSVTVDGDLDLDQVNYWLGGLLEIKSNDMYRMKGVLSIDGFDRRFVFQGVHMLFEGMPDRMWKDGEERRSRMVFIGKDLDAEVIKEGFEHCLVRKRKAKKHQKSDVGFARKK